jgi:DNA-binding LytR/AlgR family response regulator
MKKILIIEDDISIQQVITDILENENYKVFSANNGKTGIELAKALIPDLIICDVMMPIMNGYEVIENLSNDSKTSAIPFIFLSARVEKSNIRQGMELGADDYLTKPFRMEELIKAVEIRLKKKEMLIPSVTIQEDNSFSLETKLLEEDHIILKNNGEPRLVKINSIICITASADYSNVFISDGSKIFARRLLKEWEKILPKKFLRIHRSTIINLNFVEKIENWFNNSLLIRVKNHNEKFIVSRRYSVKIKSEFHFK